MTLELMMERMSWPWGIDACAIPHDTAESTTTRMYPTTVPRRSQPARRRGRDARLWEPVPENRRNPVAALRGSDVARTEQRKVEGVDLALQGHDPDCWSERRCADRARIRSLSNGSPLAPARSLLGRSPKAKQP